MKVGVLKLGARVSFSSQGTSGGTGEALSIIKMLKDGGADVTILTKILKKDNLIKDFTWVNLTDHLGSNYVPNVDALVVINGTVQFYGGAEDPEQLLNYVMINNFKGPVFYTFCDPELTLKQVWPSVEKKDWANNWSKDQLNITRKDIIYLSQPHDVEQVAKALSKNEVIPNKIIHFPFEKFPCLNQQLPVNPNPEVDLSYGGTMRGGRRAKKMVKFYFGLPEAITVEMFGKIELKDFEKIGKIANEVDTLRHPAFTGPVRYDEMLSKMNKAMCHVVIGDPWYEQINDIPQRLYESVMSQVVTFVDKDMDRIRRVWAADKELADFLYISSREELSEKIQLLKLDTSIRKEILDAQFKAIGFNTAQYCTSFVELIRKFL